MIKKRVLTLLAAFITYNIQAQEIPLHEIDPVATGNATWEVGEKTIEQKNCYPLQELNCYTLFLGITDKGHMLIQDYYESGQKCTDPYEVIFPHMAKESMSSRFSGRLTSIHGQMNIYYMNGHLIEKSFFNRGAYHGTSSRWHENGQKSSEIEYRNGWINGLWIEWDKDGNKIKEIRTPNGFREGSTHWGWYTNGQKAFETHSDASGRSHGLSTEWYSNGQKKSEITFEHGDVTSWCEWDNEGNLIKEY